MKKKNQKWHFQRNQHVGMNRTCKCDVRQKKVCFLWGNNIRKWRFEQVTVLEQDLQRKPKGEGGGGWVKWKRKQKINFDGFCFLAFLPAAGAMLSASAPFQSCASKLTMWSCNERKNVYIRTNAPNVGMLFGFGIHVVKIPVPNRSELSCFMGVHVLILGMVGSSWRIAS